jgi:hypothetical protein
MPNDTKLRVSPLKTQGAEPDRTPEDFELREAATASSPRQTGRARTLGFRPLWAAMGLVVILLGFLLYHRGTLPELRNAPRVMAQKLETLSDLRINFLKSIGAEKLAVMAETDEASLAYADESRRAAEAVDTDLQELSRLIGLYPAAEESKLLQEFAADWEQVRRIDRVILGLAVQNTNLKAFKLSFGKGRETVERFENALNAVTQNSSDARLIRAAADARAAELEILSLHAPHIVSPDDTEMNRIEQAIHAKEELVHRSLAIVARLAPADKQPYLVEAQAANREFTAVTATVIELSRQNTNVDSLGISLDRKQKAAALCEAVLDQLHAAFNRQAFDATR